MLVNVQTQTQDIGCGIVTRLGQVSFLTYLFPKVSITLEGVADPLFFLLCSIRQGDNMNIWKRGRDRYTQTLLHTPHIHACPCTRTHKRKLSG